MNFGNPKTIINVLKGESDNNKFNKENIGQLTKENEIEKNKDLASLKIDSSPEVIDTNEKENQSGLSGTQNINHEDASENKSIASYNSITTNPSISHLKRNGSLTKGFVNFIYGKQEEKQDEDADEDNMNYTPSHNEHGANHQNDILTGHNEDEEAGYKNLTFHGITSSFKGTFSTKKSTSQVPTLTGNKLRSAQSLKKKLKTSQNLFLNSGKLGKQSKEDFEKIMTDADVFRSALHEDLITMIITGSPAALLFYSYFTFDHKNNRRASLLLGALNVHVNKIGSDKHIEHADENKDSKRGFNIRQLQNEKFRIDLEYGISDIKMKWTIHKTYLEIAKLHSSLKVYTFAKNFKNDKNAIFIAGKRGLKLPKFPRSKNEKINRKKVKYFFSKTKNAATGASSKFNQKRKSGMQKIRRNTDSIDVSHDNLASQPQDTEGLSIDNPTGMLVSRSDECIPEEGEVEEDDGFDHDSSCTSESDTSNDLESIQSLSTTVPSLGSRIFNPTDHNLKQLQRIIGDIEDQTGNKNTQIPGTLNDDLKTYGSYCSNSSTHDDETENLNVRLEKYLKLLNISVGLNPLANKIFHFYELSPLGVLLSYESGFAGKQGYMTMLSSSKSNGWRVSHFRFNDWKAMVQRHTKKWFLVRHSYITFVSDIHSTTPLDVFLVDDKFKCVHTEVESKSAKTLSNFQITLQNGEREMKLLCSSEYVLKEWVASINEMAAKTTWSKPNRFASFAPVRQNCFAKLLVDGRDYFWALSEAILMARDCIFIHDWWLSPELYMRRPVEGNEAFRIDRLLRRKAEEGVKIFIIVYRNVGTTVGTDSSWTKHSLLSIHDNIHVIRSPNQWLQNTYFWAHHEKLAVVDNMIAFIGGIDLCYGRYDTPEHVLRDESYDIPKQNFPGKDYSNARHNDFFELEKPFESMHDRETVPRMPWHDVHMMTIGEVARDLSRHFVQRWNYLLRQKRPSRPTPLLTPPSDLTEEELKNLPYLDAIREKSTCECQLIRSTGSWSLGLKETDCSIQTAYIKLIETSKHYIYIENQFFVTSTSWDGIEVKNRIGDAIVDRIIKAHQDKSNWKAYIMIPLMPAFPSEVDKSDGSSLRVIMLSQYMSISTGENSIYGKLKKVGIDAGEYIQFYSLRKWSELGDKMRLVTEQVYVHAKILISDDRTCIIGSANINERSMLGDRDSEVAIVVRDTEFVNSKMDGKDYLAGRFAIEMRQRLMREHIGCDVDLVEFNDRKFKKFKNLARKYYRTLHTLSPETESVSKKDMITSACKELATRDVLGLEFTKAWEILYFNKVSGNGLPVESDCNTNGLNPDLFEDPDDFASTSKAKSTKLPSVSNIFVHTFNNRAGVFNIGIKDDKPISNDPRVKKENEEMLNPDNYLPNKDPSSANRFSKNASIQLSNWLELNVNTYRKFKDDKKENVDSEELKDYSLGVLPSREDIENYLNCSNVEVSDVDKLDMLRRVSYLQFLSAKKKQLTHTDVSNNSSINSDMVSVTTADYMDKLVNENHKILDAELQQILAMVGIPEQLSAERKKKLFYSTKDQLTSNEYNKKLKQKIFLNASFVDPYSFKDPLCDDFFQDLWFSIAIRNTLIFRLVFHCHPDSSVQTWADYREFKDLQALFEESQNEVETIINKEKEQKEVGQKSEETDNEKQEAMDHKFRNLRVKLARGMISGFDKKVYDKFTALQMLNRVHGHLVLFPLKWLSKEIELNNWFYNADTLPPIDIFN
ncbi:hypothetical protein QEN19_003243 [Hanseniaspora menglaensis]